MVIIKVAVRTFVLRFAVILAVCPFIVSPAVAGTPTPNELFTLLCMPDPQYYTTSNHPSLYNLYRRQANWIKDNRQAYNIKHVIWLGDLTNDNTIAQWGTADQAYTILDNAGVPYAVCPGNHDYKPASGWPGAHLRNLNWYNFTVGPQRFNSKPWYGGNMGETTTHNENNYTYFSGGGLDFLVIGLEYAPRKEVLTWANNLISQHPNHRVIIFTHAYMTTNGAYSGQAGSTAATVGAAGADIFTECANRHSNVFMVVCGHVTESVVNTRIGNSGNVFYEMLVDYQGEKPKGVGANLGNGWLRILQFDPANNKIYASTVTPAEGDFNIFTDGVSRFYNGPYGTSRTAVDHEFTLNYDMDPTPKPYTYLVNSTTFHATGVANDLHTDQLDADIGQDGVGNFALIWEEDTNSNGIYRINTRGFDSDANERFTKRTVNTAGVGLVSATNPSMAMAPDGRFVVAWQSGNTSIKMRTFAADGTPVGDAEENVITVTAPGTVNSPDVAIDDAGNFVVTWADDADGNGLFQIRARGYSFNYVARFAAKTVNSVATGQQVKPAIAMAGNGDYVVVWEDNKDGTWDLFMRGFRANETELFAQMLANSTVPGDQLAPDIAMDDSGRFVVVWEDNSNTSLSYQILARGFSGAGTQLFSQRTVNVISTANQVNPAVDMDNLGNWYPVWRDNGVSGTGYQIMSNTFNSAGTRVNSSDIRANPVTAVTHNFGPPGRINPIVSAHRSGRYIVGWADDMDGNDAYQILARGFTGTARSLVTKAVNGSVTRSPHDAFYRASDVVTLTAVPDPGYSFVRWTGDVPGGITTANPLPITMNTNKNVTAEFSGASMVSDWPLY